MNVAHALCTGEPLFGHFQVTNRPSRVLYLCPEMGLRSFADRLKAIGLMGEMCKTLFIRTMNKEGKLALDQLTREELDGAVVIIDTLVRYVEGEESNSDHMREFAANVFSLMAKGERPGAVCVLLLHHSPKGTKEVGELTLENAMRGSGEIGAFVTSCWATRLQDPAKPYDSASYIVNVKQRDFESKPFEAMSDRKTFRMTYVEDSNGTTLQARAQFKGNKDNMDDAADALIRANPGKSNRELSALMGEHKIKRSKDWIRLRKADMGDSGVTHTSG